MCQVSTCLNLFPSWICAYFCQLNPLIGPEIELSVLKAMIKEWGGRDVYQTILKKGTVLTEDH